MHVYSCQHFAVQFWSVLSSYFHRATQQAAQKPKNIRSIIISKFPGSGLEDTKPKGS